MRRIIQRLINCGVSIDTPANLKKCIRLTNMAAMIVSISMLPYIFLYVLNGLWPVVTTVSIISIACLLALLLNARHHYLTSRLGLVFICNGLGFVNSLLLGQETLIYLYLFVCLPSIVVLFRASESQYVSISLGYVITLLVLDLVFCIKPFTVLPLNDTVILQIRSMVVPGSLVCMLLFAMFYLGEIKRSQHRSEQLTLSSEILKNDLDSVILTDAKGMIHFANESAERLYGFNRDYLVGQSLQILGMHPCDTQIIDHALADAGHWSGEMEQYRRNGDKMTVWLRAVVVKNDEGDVLGIAYSSRDITSQKLTELALIEAKNKAEEAAVVKANFLATMSHEIRTPLNGVIGMTHLILDDNPKAEHVESLKVLQFAAENLLTLVNDVLDFSKIEAGRISLEQAPFDLVGLLRNIERSAGYSAKEKGLRFVVEIDQELEGMFIGDAARLTQILVNLTSNAIKFTETGTVSLLVSINQPVSENSPLMVRFSVRDTGIGISEKNIQYIFEQFAQADTSITRKYGGSGLGLSITKGLLSAWESEVSVSSEPGVGSEFSFALSLPVCNGKKNDRQDIETSRLSGSAEDRILSVLVAEDNPVNVMVINKLLKTWGLDADIVNNGEEALEKLAIHRYDLVLMDIQMPVMDGLQATRHIRGSDDPWLREIPVIALTATMTDDVKHQIREVGMNDMLGKPFNPLKLRQKIIAHCEKQSIGEKTSLISMEL